MKESQLLSDLIQSWTSCILKIQPRYFYVREARTRQQYDLTAYPRQPPSMTFSVGYIYSISLSGPTALMDGGDTAADKVLSLNVSSTARQYAGKQETATTCSVCCGCTLQASRRRSNHCECASELDRVNRIIQSKSGAYTSLHVRDLLCSTPNL
jgi:hypothetical protein